jgi:iron complex outermembrane receptor protein
MVLFSKMLRLSTSALCLCLPIIAHAQQPAVTQGDGSTVANTTGDDLEQIIVTAQRRSERLQDVPMAITSLGEAALQRAPITNISDLQTSVPSLNVSPRNGSGVVAIRGIGYDVVTAGADGSVAIHNDGVYQSRPAAALTSLYDVERIEVARGPQGTLYGRNATGGAINIISNKPTSSFEGYLGASYGNYNAMSFEGAISGPVAGDRLSARVAAKLEQRDGWGTNLFNGKDVDDVESQAIRAMLDFRPIDTVSFLLTGEYFQRDDNANALHFDGCVTPVCNANAAINRGFLLPANPRNVDQDAQALYAPEQYGVSLTTRVELPFADLTAISGYTDGKSYFFGDFDGTAQLGSFVTREENYHTFSQELQLGRSGGKVDWIVGAFFFDEQNFARTNAHFPPFLAPALSRVFQGGTLDTSAYAAFGELSYHITPELTVTVGGRYSDERKHLEDEYAFTNGPVNMVARQAAPTADVPCVTCRGLPERVKFDAFTPKFGVQYQFSSDQMIYFTAQKGFKSGGFAVGQVTPSFAPETIWSYEAGLKADWFGRTLTTNLAVYHYDYKDLQVGQVVGVGTIITNAGSAQIDGVEAEFRLRAGSHISFDGFGSYNHARFSSYTSANPAINIAVPLDLSGNLLSNAPEWTGKIGAEYSSDAFGGSLTLRGEMFTSSRVYFSPFNNLTNSQDSYTLFNASLRYEGPNDWSTSLFANNITDELVTAGTIVSSNAVGGFISAQYLPPRMYGIRITKQF